MDTKEHCNSFNNGIVKDIDSQIKSDYDMIMKNCPKIISSQWEKIGENYKQFSLYDDNYETKVLNCTNFLV